MQRDSRASTSSSRDRSEVAELDALRGLCGRQSVRIAILEDAATRDRARTGELTRQNAELSRRLRSPLPSRVDVAFAADALAPAVARSAVARALEDDVAPAVLDDARLVVSELVTNAVLHAGARSSSALMARIEHDRASVLVEVVRPGRDEVFAAGPGMEASDGFSLRLVQALSERWGVEWESLGGTRTWAQLGVT